MSRVKIEWRSGSRENYNNFCDTHPGMRISFDQWKTIVYGFNETFREYILETGNRAKFPFGFGEWSITKKKRKRIKSKDGKDFINLPVDWAKTREKGKLIYNFNFHTEGFFFGWMWFKSTSRIKNVDLWYFKPVRATSRLLSHYINVDEKYKNIYREWNI